jgi:hypothetical protein
MKSNSILKQSAVLCTVFSIVLFGLSLQKVESPPLDHTPPKFVADSAFNYMKSLATGFPYRVTWSEQRKKAGNWIKDEFRKMGYEPQSQFFSEVIAGKRYTDLENIYAVKVGSKFPDQIIVLSGHYDIVDTTIEGAMDDASGVGVVMELARIFSKEKTDRTMIFMAADSEEYGALWGSRAFAKDFAQAREIVAVENFDFVAPETQTKILMLCDGLKTGYTPLWLREIALGSLRSVGGVEAVDLTNIVEAFARAIGIPAADHGSYLAAGIPAFNWVGQTDRFGYEMAHYHHTQFDNTAAMQVASFGPYGQAAERVLRTIDHLPQIPKDFRDSSYWKINSRYYISGFAVTLLHILVFIPFLAFSVCKFAAIFRRGSRKRILKVLRNEAKNMGIVLISLLLGYAVLLILPLLKVITQYETFPATQKSEMLYSPNFLAILIVIATVAGAFWLFRKLFSEPDDSIEDASIRHALHFAFLALVILLAMVKNSYLAVLLLLPPAYLWSLVRTGPRKKSRTLNLLLILGGSVTFIAVLVVMSTLFHIGVAYWYLFLASAYGLISAYSVVLFVMALTIMIRLVRAFVL